jgi:hypothetical protein
MRHAIIALGLLLLAACVQNPYDNLPTYQPPECGLSSGPPSQRDAEIDIITGLGYKYPSTRMFHFQARNVGAPTLTMATGACAYRFNAEVSWSEIQYPFDSDWTKHDFYLHDGMLVSYDPPLDLQRPCGPPPETKEIAANIIKAGLDQNPLNRFELRNFGDPALIKEDPDYCLYRISAEVRETQKYKLEDNWSAWVRHDFYINHADVIKADPTIPYIHSEF